MDTEIKKYLGIDWGEKRIGLATADSETGLALPFRTVASLEEVLAVLAEEEIDVIVLGQPTKMSGRPADSEAWLSFLKLLEEKSGRPVKTMDERLSSQAADAQSGEPHEKAARDEVAAAIILQDYLDIKALD